MYCIIDIETTGGKYDEEGITEIAVYKYDGHEVVDQFFSLVNPEREIQDFVVKLTGIDKKMLRNAPRFHEIARRLVTITGDSTLVAHNVDFDYRILKTEFRRLGFNFESKRLCTVKLSKKLMPGFSSYSLGNLCRSLGIPVTNRHRARGDAMATLKLFKFLIAKDKTKELIRNAVDTGHKKELAPKFRAILNSLSQVTGVYYMHREDGTIIYIGSSKNIKRSVNRHFISDSSKAKKIQHEVAAITYEETGSELVAYLKEFEELKENRPLYNRIIPRRTLFPYGLYCVTDKIGYKQLYMSKTTAKEKAVAVFNSLQEAEKALYKLTEKYRLCQKINKLQKFKKQCFLYDISQCNGACIKKESAEDYNKRAEEAVKEISCQNQCVLIIDKGRHQSEKSVILIENGEYKGYGFTDLAYQMTELDILRNVITPSDNGSGIWYFIQNYLRKKRVEKLMYI